MIIFNRKYRFLVGSPYPVSFSANSESFSKVENLADHYKNATSNGFLIEDFRVSFNIKKASTANKDTSDITFYNLSDYIVNYLIQYQDKNLACLFEVGYESEGVKTIFRGTIDSVEDDFSGKDRATKLILGDGSVNIQEAMSSRSYPRGTLLTTVVGELALDMGLPIARVDAVDNPKIDLSRTFHGHTATVLQKLAKDNNCRFSVIDGYVYFTRLDSRFKTEVVMLTADSGLIGVPKPINDSAEKSTKDKKKEKTALEVKCLLDGSISPESTVYVRSGRIDGAFKVQKVEYSGDSRGTDWYCILECIKASNIIAG